MATWGTSGTFNNTDTANKYRQCQLIYTHGYQNISVTSHESYGVSPRDHSNVCSKAYLEHQRVKYFNNYAPAF